MTAGSNLSVAAATASGSTQLLGAQNHGPPPPAPLPVVETFHSIQGEGCHAGRSAFFIRLAGCSVGCPWCDTKPSWPVTAHPSVAITTLAEQARQGQLAGAAFTVITGGEPLHHNLDALCHALDSSPLALPIHLETSGVDPLSGRFDWITLSPKRHRPPQQQALAACQELKVVVGERDDLAFAEAMAHAADQAGRPASAASPVLLLQPLWESTMGQELAIIHVRQNPRWRLSLQSHKWLGVR